MPSDKIRELRAELDKVEESLSRAREGGAVSISEDGMSTTLISIGALNMERTRLLKRIKEERERLAGVRTLGGVVEFRDFTRDETNVDSGA